MTHDDRIAKVIGFEPHPMTAEALRASAELAPAGKVEVIEKGVGAKASFAGFDLRALSPTSAGLSVAAGHEDSAEIPVCTLDETIQLATDTPLILLIDIEGGELDALRGGKSLIARLKPLIIFEYNATTRRHFALSEAGDFLGADYELFRLRSEDGCLDRDLSDTWNVVALPKEGHWRHLRQQQGLILK